MRVYGWNSGQGGCGWYRIREPLRGMEFHGVHSHWGPELTEEIVSWFDTILVHILWQEKESEAWEDLAKAGDHRLVFDIDDDVWAYDESTANAKHYTPEVLARVERNIRLASLVTTPSEILAQRIIDRGLHDKVYVLPNYVPEFLLGLPLRSEGPFTVGYQGAPQHQIDITYVGRELLKVLLRNTKARLAFYGPGRIDAPGWPKERIDSFPWQEDIFRYYTSLKMDVGIGPLAPIPFNEAKSGIRAVEYCALGIPGVYSDRSPYREFIEDGINGFLVSDREMRRWSKELLRFAQRPESVYNMSAHCREKASQWTTEANGYQWVGAYTSV